MLTSAIDRRLGVVDLHCHPSMMSYNYGARFWKAHNPPVRFWPWAMRTDLDALIAGGVKTFLCTTYALERVMFKDVWPLRVLAALYPPAGRVATAPIRELTFEHLDAAERMVEEARRRRGDVIEFGRSFAEMQRITGEGKICMLHAIEGAHHLDGDIGMVDRLFERGVCQMIVPHLYPNEACGCLSVFDGMNLTGKLGCFSRKHQSTAGLSAWGRELVEKLLDVGIIVDPTHGTRELRQQVFDMVRGNSRRRPVVMSHACVPCPSPEGMGPVPDEIRQIADTGGVVGVMMYTHRDPGQGGGDGIQYVLNAIEHLIRHGGEEVVAIGSDFDGTPDAPKDLRSPRAYRNLREALLGRYSEEQVGKFLSANAERVLKHGWGRQ